MFLKREDDCTRTQVRDGMRTERKRLNFRHRKRHWAYNYLFSLPVLPLVAMLRSSMLDNLQVCKKNESQIVKLWM